MKLTFTKSKFDVPEGQYVTRFAGLEMLDPKPGEAPRLGRDGKPMAPGMAWRFEILEGPETGKQADRVTGRIPGPKNVCGRFLAAVTGQLLKDGMEVDLDQYVGKRYRVNVVPKEQSEGTCVSDQGIVPLDAAPVAAPATNGGPPPRKKAPAAEQWYVVTNPDADPVVMTKAEAEKWMVDNGKWAKETEVCKVGGTEYVTAEAAGMQGAAF